MKPWPKILCDLYPWAPGCRTLRTRPAWVGSRNEYARRRYGPFGPEGDACEIRLVEALDVVHRSRYAGDPEPGVYCLRAGLTCSKEPLKQAAQEEFYKAVWSAAHTEFSTVDEAVAAFDREHPVQFPGIRAGQWWGIRSAIQKTFTVFQIAPNLNLPASQFAPVRSWFGSYDGFGVNEELLAAEGYLLHDTICPWLSPWASPVTNSGPMPRGS